MEIVLGHFCYIEALLGASLMFIGVLSSGRELYYGTSLVWEVLVINVKERKCNAFSPHEIGIKKREAAVFPPLMPIGSIHMTFS